MAARPTSEDAVPSNNPAEDQELVSDTECPICYQICVHPVRLPCRHVFCFLCAKGVVHRTRRCAMCRQAVDPSYLDDPDLVDSSHLEVTNEKDKILWFYQARSQGWWLYEKRIATEIEKRYQQSKDVFDLQIAGYIYTIDLENMVQYRKDNSSIRRAIKRDLITHVADVKGNAGLRLEDSTRRRDNADSSTDLNSKADNISDMVSQLSLDQHDEAEPNSDNSSSDPEILV